MISSLLKIPKKLDYIPTTNSDKATQQMLKEVTSFKHPVHLKDGSRISGFNNADQTIVYGYTKTGEKFTMTTDSILEQGLTKGMKASGNSKNAQKTVDSFKDHVYQKGLMQDMVSETKQAAKSYDQLKLKTRQVKSQAMDDLLIGF